MEDSTDPRTTTEELKDPTKDDGTNDGLVILAFKAS